MALPSITCYRPLSRIPSGPVVARSAPVVCANPQETLSRPTRYLHRTNCLREILPGEPLLLLYANTPLDIPASTALQPLNVDVDVNSSPSSDSPPNGTGDTTPNLRP